MGRSAHAAQAAKLVRDNSIIEAKGETDTIRLWENYRDQALLWRSMALLQIPATLAAVIFAFTLWVTGDIILNVPAKPLPGIYTAQEIPDTEFFDTATNFLNLIATYQPGNARKQFTKAREMLTEPLFTRFSTEMMETELRTVETTSRTQIFFADPTKTTITREGDEVVVEMTGERLKIVAGKDVPTVLTKYTVTMKTLPQNTLNPFGIAVSNIVSENIKEN